MKNKEDARALLKNFNNSIKYENRFFMDEQFSKDLKTVINLHRDTYNTGSSLYRARINNKEEKNAYEISKMKSPPINRVSGGRANTEGINTNLYTITDIKYTFHEIT
ncbi:hypothetical protein OW763_06285 [Clostridium aestuarii]|uniref:Uncharacterized protein n=1 Tax=Clostridium aestuarii TaxID=338193 RepID=A0ABT4CYA0_9CLOT|nr:hypothetical protein [Clostridium aestuarii]MCY6483956.1 hypothetical protein [Clostridium aestuarii]